MIELYHDVFGNPYWDYPRPIWLHPLTQGIAARSDTTAQTGVAEGKSPVGSADAPEVQP